MTPKIAVILAGGKGSRIKKYLDGRPKPMVKINKKYFLNILIRKLSRYDFEKIIIIGSFRGKLIKNEFDSRNINFVNIKYIHEKRAQGTGGALYQLKKKLKNDFLLFNGDSIFDFDLDKFKFTYKKTSILISLSKNNIYDSNNKLSNLGLRKNLIFYDTHSKLMNGGVYLIKHEFFKYIKNKFLSLEDDIIPGLINKKKVEGKFFSDFFYDIGTPNNLKKANNIFKKYFKKPAVFLDRDGVINYDKEGYTYKINDFKFKPNVIKALKYLNDKNYYIFIITNQAGIAKGKYSIRDFEKLSKYIKSFLSKKKIYIDEVKFCPHHPEGKLKKFQKKCLCRKPQNQLFQDIKENYDIDVKNSFMIGDQPSDELMANKSKLYFEYDYSNLLKQVKKIIKIKQNGKRKKNK